MTENQIKSIVEEVMAKMQLSGNTSGMHGVFSDMNTAIAKAKEAQKIVRVIQDADRPHVAVQNHDLSGDDLFQIFSDRRFIIADIHRNHRRILLQIGT